VYVWLVCVLHSRWVAYDSLSQQKKSTAWHRMTTFLDLGLLRVSIFPVKSLDDAIQTAMSAHFHPPNTYAVKLGTGTPLASPSLSGVPRMTSTSIGLFSR
jgi:hypothetical protein